MNVHKNARLTPHSRAELVRRVMEQHQTPKAVATDRGRVARPFGSALTDSGMRLSRTRLFPEVTCIVQRAVPMGE